MEIAVQTIITVDTRPSEGQLAEQRHQMEDPELERLFALLPLAVLSRTNDERNEK